MTKSAFVLAGHCPTCAKHLTIHVPTNSTKPGVKPEEGDTTICGKCLSILTVGPSDFLHETTAEEFLAMPDDFRIFIVRAQRHAEEMKEILQAGRDDPEFGRDLLSKLKALASPEK
jgi:hypothetical protein